MEISIRNLSAADIPAADKIVMSAFGQSESRLDEMRRYLEIQPDGWFVAEQAGLLLGMVGAVDYGAFAYIGLMVVWPEFQGRGIGRLLNGAPAWAGWTNAARRRCWMPPKWATRYTRNWGSSRPT